LYLPESAMDDGLQFIQGTSGVVAQAAFMTAQVPSTALRSGGVAGQLHHGQPALASLGQVAHLLAEVGAEPPR
jgi:hypothetical protein